MRLRRRPTAEEYAALLRRIERIERRLGLEPESEARPEAAAPAAAPARPALETRIGLAWLNRIGAVTLILGAGFFFRLAVENRWIGETARVALGCAGGLAALYFADRLWRRGQTVFAQGITATGISVLYLAVYAGFALYNLFPAYLAFAAMALVTAAAGALSLRYGSAAIAVLGFFGGYATPLLLGTGTESAWFYLNYLLALNLAAIELRRRRGWRLPVVVALLATVVLFGSWLGQPVEDKWLGTVYTLAFYAVFAAVPLRPVFFAAQALAPFTVTAIWPDRLFEFGAPLTLLAAAGLAVSDRRNWSGGALTAGLAAWGAQAVWYNGAAPPFWPVLFQQSVLFALFAAWTLWRPRRGAAVGGAEALLLAANAAFYFGLLYAQLGTLYSAWRGLAAISLASVHMLLARRMAGPVAPAAAGIAWVLLVLAVPIQFSGSRVAMLWALEAAAMAWIAGRFRLRLAAYAALATFLPALLGLPWGGAHLLTYVVAAASLWAAARWLPEPRHALAVYVLGHFVMLWGLLRESVAWAMRSGPADIASFVAAASTILMAAYALSLVALGVFRRSPLDRMLGLGLVGLVLAKLYFHDVWLLGRVYRVAAFGGLGALLLGTSYLYSRFRVRRPPAPE